MITILLNPALLSVSPQIERCYIRMLTEADDCAYLLLKPYEDTAPLIRMMLDVYRVYTSQEDGYELELEVLFFQMWLFLYKTRPTNSTVPVSSRQDLCCLKEMLSYVDRYFMQQISLADISGAGQVSQSKCFELFSRFIGQTPNTCLTMRRLKESQKLLIHTDLTMGQIADCVGFSGSSYFAERFRQYCKCTPTEYRQVHKPR